MLKLMLRIPHAFVFSKQMSPYDEKLSIWLWPLTSASHRNAFVAMPKWISVFRA